MGEVPSGKCQVLSRASRASSPGSLPTSDFTLHTSNSAAGYSCQTNPIPAAGKKRQVLCERGFMVNRTVYRPRQNKANCQKQGIEAVSRRCRAGQGLGTWDDGQMYRTNPICPAASDPGDPSCKTNPIARSGAPRRCPAGPDGTGPAGRWANVRNEANSPGCVRGTLRPIAQNKPNFSRPRRLGPAEHATSPRCPASGNKANFPRGKSPARELESAPGCRPPGTRRSWIIVAFLPAEDDNSSECLPTVHRLVGIPSRWGLPDAIHRVWGPVELVPSKGISERSG